MAVDPTPALAAPSPPAADTKQLAREAPAVDEQVENQTASDRGLPRMTPEVLEKCCLENNGFSSPELNEVLILHYKGFRKIECLAAYSQVKSLFLECNGIRKIEGLEGIPGLVSLYLQSNCIQKIENLDALTSLKYLNLSQNSISSVENLGGLHGLETLNISANKITLIQGLEGLRERPSLKSIDVSCNYVEDGDGLLDFWADAAPQVECLYLHHNPCSRMLKDGRRRLISQLRKLRWLDERPVTPLERAGCEAWAVGGKDAEQNALKEFCLREKEEKARSFENFRLLQQAAAARARAQREAQAERDHARPPAGADADAARAARAAQALPPHEPHEPHEPSAACGAVLERQFPCGSAPETDFSTDLQTKACVRHQQEAGQASEREASSANCELDEMD